MSNTEHLIKSIKENAREHSSIPFWSWNDKLEKDILADQIKGMKELGMRGFFMHARGGLETGYLSEEWFDAIRFCTEEAKRLGMEAWAYDENGWPSGFAGGELLKDPANHACGVVIESATEITNDENILGVYVVENGKVRFANESDSGEFTVIRRVRDFSYVDTMDADVTAKYIELTHERYKREVGEEFGKAMPGFFTDEPQYFRYGTPWSDKFPVSFKARFGYDVIEKLPLLFLELEGYESFRYDYYLHCHESFYNGFMKPVYQWCEDNGVKLTGHGIEEWGLAGQMACCGGVMPFYLYQHIPGIDYLKRDIKNVSGPRQLASVCEQTGKMTRLTETFACCGWDASPREIKQIAELQFVGGVNLVCEHLYAYSERGQRKRDYPNHYSEHNPWFEYYPDFETHFKNLGSALSMGRELADTLVIHPIRSAYLRYGRSNREPIKALDKQFSAFIDKFSLDHICYHFGDEGIMEEMGAVEGATIRVGRCVYDKVVLPCCETLTANTVSMLREYLANGGKLYIDGDTPTRVDGRGSDLSFLKSNITYEQLCAEGGVSITKDGSSVPVLAQVRLTDAGRVIFIANTTTAEYSNVEIRLADCMGLEELDIATLERKPLRGKREADGSVTVLYDFGNAASVLLVEGECDMESFTESEDREYLRLDGSFTFDELPENMIMLENASISQNGGEFTDERHISRIRDNLLSERFEGRLKLRFKFETETVPKELFLVVEPEKYCGLKVNGEAVTFIEGHRIDRRFLMADIAKSTVLGDNYIELELDYFQREEVYRVLYGGGNEALRNCLCFDTELEAVYLYGDFAVRSHSEFVAGERNTYRNAGDFLLCQRSKEIDLTDIVKDGYPFFAGKMRASSVFNYKNGDPTLLKLSGRFAVSEVEINGQELGHRLFTDEYELAPYLVEGDNKITLTLCFSNRNLLGPHHRRDPEPIFVSPSVFSYEKDWKGDTCERFVKDWAFVRFGIGF